MDVLFFPDTNITIDFLLDYWLKLSFTYIDGSKRCHNFAKQEAFSNTCIQKSNQTSAIKRKMEKYDRLSQRKPATQQSAWKVLKVVFFSLENNWIDIWNPFSALVLFICHLLFILMYCFNWKGVSVRPEKSPLQLGIEPHPHSINAWNCSPNYCVNKHKKKIDCSWIKERRIVESPIYLPEVERLSAKPTSTPTASTEVRKLTFLWLSPNKVLIVTLWS